MKNINFNLLKLAKVIYDYYVNEFESSTLDVTEIYNELVKGNIIGLASTEADYSDMAFEANLNIAKLRIEFVVDGAEYVKGLEFNSVEDITEYIQGVTFDDLVDDDNFPGYSKYEDEEYTEEDEDSQSDLVSLNIVGNSPALEISGNPDHYFILRSNPDSEECDYKNDFSEIRHSKILEIWNEISYAKATEDKIKLLLETIKELVKGEVHPYIFDTLKLVGDKLKFFEFLLVLDNNEVNLKDLLPRYVEWSNFENTESIFYSLPLKGSDRIIIKHEINILNEV